MRLGKTFGRIAAALALAMGLAAPAVAGTLDDIKERGTLRMGVLGELPPWGFIDNTGASQGYDVEVGTLLAEELGVKPEFMPMTVQARIPSLTTGKVDMLLATMGMYPDRAKAVQFSKPYAGLKIILIADKATPITTIEDARGLRIGVPKASAQDTAITKALGEDSRIQRFDDDAATVQALVSGQVDAIGGNTTYKMSIDKARPENTFEQKVLFNEQWMGVATPLGDAEVNAFLNDFIDKIKADGRLEAINAKWINQPLPAFPESLEGVPFTVQ